MTISNYWADNLQAGQSGIHLFDEFALRAREAMAEVHRVASADEIRTLLLHLIEEVQARHVVAVPCPLQDCLRIYQAIEERGIPVYYTQADIAEHAPTADIGMSSVAFGIAETGSICQDATMVESRLVSTLPPVHVAFLHNSHILPGITEAMDVLAETFHQGYLSFITGPSRTADIERVLTIGVHGPSRLIIVAIDDTCYGGTA